MDYDKRWGRYRIRLQPGDVDKSKGILQQVIAELRLFRGDGAVLIGVERHDIVRSAEYLFERWVDHALVDDFCERSNRRAGSLRELFGVPRRAFRQHAVQYRLMLLIAFGEMSFAWALDSAPLAAIAVPSTTAIR